MRLLTCNNPGELGLTRDLMNDEIPPYAILSHTWQRDEDEVTFRDIGSGSYLFKTGFRKIEFCRKQAQGDGYRHFWVDTCCIDKANNNELSEAIISMYRWYQNAQVCYVYLIDVSSGRNEGDLTTDDTILPRSWKPSFRKSRWFTRGWTLQELLAPKQVVFYSKEWDCLGTKSTLTELLQEITGIPAAALRNNKPMSQFTVIERLSWTKSRETKKEEDKAYCLLGIFGVFMPLIYGEGENAFARLMKQINDTDIVMPPLHTVKGAAFDSYGQAHQRCHPNTRAEVLQSIQEWALHVQGESIFWLNGTAGTGKSTISWTVAKLLADFNTSAPVTLAASFFFKRGEGERASAALLFPTIADQLATRIHNFDVFLAQAVRTDPQICNKSLGEQFKKLISEPLQRLHHQEDHKNYIVVIDALDECENEEDIRVVLKLWSILSSNDAIRLRLFLTSRPELAIRLGFKKMPTSTHHDLILHELPRPVIQHDIHAFLSTALDEVRKDYNLTIEDDLINERLAEDWPGCQTLQKLTQIAMPLFIVAATIYRLLRRADHPQERLNTILHSHKSAALSEMSKIYTVVLQAMTMSLQDGEDISKLHERFRAIVGTIITLAEPLSRTALAALLDIRPGEVQVRLRLLHAVLEIPTDKDSVIRPLHLSFGEFLTSQEIQQMPYWIDTKATHAFLWRQCLKLLSLATGLRENICDLEYPGRLRSTVPSVQVNESLQSDMRYACRYWVYHVQQSDQQLQDEDEVHVFLKKHFLHWLEALSLMNQISEAVSLLAVLQSCIALTTSNLMFFLEDARRFLLAHRYIIDLAPLQLYSSMIIFTPQNSVVRSTCGKLPDWIRQRPETLTDWSSELQKLEGHSRGVSTVSLSGDGSLLASGSEDLTIRLWDPRTGQELQKLNGHSDTVTSVAFSNDSSLLASGSNDGTVRLWDPRTSQELQKLEGHSSWVRTVAFSSEGSLLASGSWDHTVRLWDPQTGQEVQKLNGHSSAVTIVAFSSDGSLLASGSNDRTVRLWDPETAQEVQRLEGHSGIVRTVAFSSDGSLLASGSNDQTVRLWDPRTGLEVQNLTGHSDIVSAVAFSRDSSLLASGSWDKTVRLWNLRTGQEVQKLERHTDSVTDVAFSNDGSLLASGSVDSTVRLWDPQTRQKVQKLENRSHSVTAVAFSSDGSLLACGFSDNMVQLWDSRTGQEVQKLEGHSDMVTAVGFSSDGSLLASGSDDRTVRLWNPQTGQELRKLERHSYWVRIVVFSSDGSLLAVGTEDGTVRLWNLRTGQELRKLEGHSHWVRTVVFSSDNSLLAVGSDDGTVRLWNLQTGQELRKLEVIPAVDIVCFTYNNTALITNHGTYSLGNDQGESTHCSSLEPTRDASIDISKNWIRHNKQNLLWLPQEYRGVSTFHGDRLAIGAYSGLVSIFQFRLDEM